MSTTITLQSMIDQQYIKVQQHPEKALYIYNYTPKAQYERCWNEWTLHCRGLILDGEGKIVARPFPKFFNWGEFEEQVIPDEPFEVYDKMDGSLGILFWDGGEPFIASRGSFTSMQSLKANELLHGKYKDALTQLNPACTYLFEIIYPENKIVVDYGQTEALVLLGIVHTASGEELPLEDIGFPLVRRFDDIHDLGQLKHLERDNKEGFVIKFKSGLRLKVKFEEYVRLHRIITMVSSISIWEYLKTGETMDDILDRVPDEFYDWVKMTRAGLLAQYEHIELQAKADFKVLESRKETALYFMTCAHPKVLFQMLEGKPYNKVIWKKLRPKFERPFSLGKNIEL